MLISVCCTGGVVHFFLMVKRSFVVTYETGAMVDLCYDGILSHVLVANYGFPCYYQCTELCSTKVLNVALVDLAP